MAEDHQHESKCAAASVEAGDRSMFDFMEKKKCEEEVMATEFEEKVKVSNSEEKKNLVEKLHRSSSSSSDEDEVEEGAEKKEKKKGLKEKKEEEPINKCDHKPTQDPEEKKGFLDKIKEKLPGGKKAEEVASPPPTPPVAAECAATPEKKGFLDKIKQRIPGYYSKSDEEKEKANV